MTTARRIHVAYEPLGQLVHQVRPVNPKRHDLAALGESVAASGFVTPLVLNESDGLLLEGHGRLAWLLHARDTGGTIPDGVRVGGGGEWLVPVVRGVYLSTDAARRFLIAANRTVELGGWDTDALVSLLQEIEGSEAGLAGTGFDETSLDELLASLEDEVAPGGGDPDAAPALGTSPLRVSAGDLWALGEHRLWCGDARDLPGLTRLLGSRQAAVMWTDPPYGVSYTGGGGLTIANDDAAGVEALLRGAFAAADAILNPGAAVYVAHPAGALSLTFAQAFVDVGWHLHQTLIWVKDQFVLGHADYHYRHEPLLYGWKPGKHRWRGGRTQQSVFEVERPKQSREHPTMKPVALVEAQLRNSSVRGDLVFDPFVGSGTTLVACERLKRRCAAIELDPRYADVVLARWERLTGGEAVRL